jgi:dTDP-3-amino-2,3,6-trideoxy-4-keto-D-glucose/dTDP-3-amino-3,4,6-trideoxy-alpha-D-glucose/dTDP-2,6-dideoxy-D-kanosamine transaminase
VKGMQEGRGLSRAGPNHSLVPVNDPARCYRTLREPVDTAISRVVESGRYVLGAEVVAFETELAAFIGVENAVTVANGTDALEIALMAAGVKPEDRVITVANAGTYTSTAVTKIGASPLYVDVDPVDLLMDPACLAEALEGPVAAVVVTHLYGLVAPMNDLLPLCRARGVPVIEDCAQAIGAGIDGRRAGSFGDLATFSFYPTKNLGALGDGGAVVTNQADLAQVVRELRQYGWADKYQVVRSGGRNSRLDEIQAAVLRVKLPYVLGWNARRREILGVYHRATSGTSVRVVGHAIGERSAAHLAVLVTQDRERLRERMTLAGVATDIHYPIPDHRQTVNAGLSVELPVTERMAGAILTVPCFPEMEEDEIVRVQRAIRG